VSVEIESNLRSAVQMLAADNARLCDRLLAAERVVDLARRSADRALIAEVQNYDAGRPS
jgi:hypothetical protein